MKIKEIAASTPVSGRYLITENQLKVAKNGSNYLAMKIADPSGELAVKVWSADEELFNCLAAGRVIELHNVQPKVFKDQMQLEWEGKNQALFKVLPEHEVDYGQFLPAAPGNLTDYWNYIAGTIESVTTPDLQKILKHFFGNRDFAAQFMRVPAALKRHHVYVGGLLEHTAGVTAMCRAAADYYPAVNRDLLLTGAILHDIGKTKTYQLGKGFSGTDEGKLIGHLVLGVEMVNHAIAETMDANTPKSAALKNQLLHLLVSHHGIMEWGSPVEPLIIEACILHHADNLDAQVTKFLTIIRAESGETGWSAFDPGLGRSIYIHSRFDRPDAQVKPEEQ